MKVNNVKQKITKKSFFSFQIYIYTIDCGNLRVKNSLKIFPDNFVAVLLL